jgi:hypothetical protein
MFSKKQILVVVVMGWSVLVLSGCETKFTVSHYPGFYKSSIKSVAVLPFENESSRKGAGIAVANHLSAALAANGTYKVTGPGRVEELIKEKDMPSLQEKDDRAIAEELAKLNEYQAFITGIVLSDSFTNTLVEDYNEDFYYYGYPYWYSPDWYPPPYWYYPYYYEYGGKAYVSVNVSMVSIPDGTVLDSVALKAAADASNKPSSLKKYATQMALKDLSEKIVHNFAVFPMEISVQPDKAMRTADTIEQEKWHFTKTFSSGRESMYVVLCLPAAAAMNQFRLTITPQNNSSNDIMSKDFTWERDKYCQSVEFSPKQIVRSNGPGKYSVHFLSRGKIIFSRRFIIE